MRGSSRWNGVFISLVTLAIVTAAHIVSLAWRVLPYFALSRDDLGQVGYAYSRQTYFEFYVPYLGLEVVTLVLSVGIFAVLFRGYRQRR